MKTDTNPVNQLISSNPLFTKEIKDTLPTLNVAEFFGPTIQGENFTGQPCYFLRLQGCTQCCTWCDTKSVWRFGNPYTFNELFNIMESNKIIDNLFNGSHHLIITGGSPLKQQQNLLEFFKEFENRYAFVPHIEIENECTLMPIEELCHYIYIWNNSPKLSNSGNPERTRYRPEVIERLASLPNSWFKFVISEEIELQEIKEKFIDTKLIQLNQIVLMPKGGTKSELELNRRKVAEMAIESGVRFTDRLHVTIWDKMTGV